MPIFDGRKPLERLLADSWQSIDPAFRKAFLAVIVISLLTFGFEMTNLALHHDDVVQIFIQDTILGHYLGRFGTGWLHYYMQQAHFMPFLQMAQGIVFMTAYGLLIAHLWGVRKTLDSVLIASVVCVFPYMAQVYQYNTAMATYTIAHLLSALAVYWSVKATVRHVAAAAVAYMFAFSIYQSVIGNAAAILAFWFLASLIFQQEPGAPGAGTRARSVLAALLAVGIGGLIYLGAVSLMDLHFDAYQDAGEAFKLEGGLHFSLAANEVLKGTRSFFFYPENYFPDYLKKLQLVLLFGASALCLWLPRGVANKIGALLVLILGLFAPRLLQWLHPKGDFHNLTLTAYAVVVAGCLMVILRTRYVQARNLAALLAFFLIWGYVIQGNWISSVNYLNTQAHYSTMTQIMAQIRSLPAEGWDGKTVVVAGRHAMYSGYPYKKATGVASEFIDAGHMQLFAHLLRDDTVFVDIESASDDARQYVSTHAPWPHPGSVGVVGGRGVVVLSGSGSAPGKLKADAP
jgi:hypothetical protein